MKILNKDLKSAMSSKLSLSDRGMLLTIILCKDPDARIWWAKIKINIGKYDDDARRSLINLHEQHFIKWNAYKGAVKRMQQDKDLPKALEVLDFMNNLYGTKYLSTTASHIAIIISRLRDGETVDNLKLVISNRWESWKDEPVMCKHLNPGTIFRAKNYAKYVEEATRTNIGKRFVEAEAHGLNEGDQVTMSNCINLVDSEVYHIKRREVNNEQVNMITSTRERFYGKDIKLNLKRQDNKMRAGRSAEFIYEYLNK